MNQRLLRAWFPYQPIYSSPSFRPAMGWFLLVDSRAIVATLPSALLRLSPQVPIGVLNSRGAAISVTN